MLRSFLKSPSFTDDFFPQFDAILDDKTLSHKRLLILILLLLPITYFFHFDASIEEHVQQLFIFEGFELFSWQKLMQDTIVLMQLRERGFLEGFWNVRFHCHPINFVIALYYIILPSSQYRTCKLHVFISAKRMNCELYYILCIALHNRTHLLLIVCSSRLKI